jgi:adenine/guanine/hypoxanthine permease
MLGNGFIITSMLWASLVVALIDSKLRRAAGILLVAAVLCAFGFIHSALPSDGIYLPWTLDELQHARVLQFSTAYVVLAGIILLLSVQRARPTGTDEET